MVEQNRFVALHKSGNGPEQQLEDVRYYAAVTGKADIRRTTNVTRLTPLWTHFDLNQQWLGGAMDAGFPRQLDVTRW